MRNYIKNLETGKIELHFTKSEYQALTAEQKAELKRHYLWSRTAEAWVSRSKNHHYSAIEIAKKLGFECEEVTGQRLSFEEELQRKAEKAEHRAERFEQYAENANNRGQALQSEFKNLKNDWAWVTQPIIRGHAGSEAFGKRRQRVIDRYEKGFSEYRKSDYFKERAEIARQSADLTKLQDKVYLHNRIQETNKQIKYYQNLIAQIENQNYNNSQQGLPERDLTEYLDKLEWEIDKLAFLENCIDDIGGVTYNRGNVRPGYLVKIRGTWDLVLKANKTTVYIRIVQGGAMGMELKYPYAEIQDVKIPEGWTEPKEELENPFEVGDILIGHYIGTNKIARAYQITKKTNKTVTIQRIAVEDHTPIKDSFISTKMERKAVKKDNSGNIVVNDDNWYLYRYTPKEQAV